MIRNVIEKAYNSASNLSNHIRSFGKPEIVYEEDFYVCNRNVRMWHTKKKVTFIEGYGDKPLDMRVIEE